MRFVSCCLVFLANMLDMPPKKDTNVWSKELLTEGLWFEVRAAKLQDRKLVATPKIYKKDDLEISLK